MTLPVSVRVAVFGRTGSGKTEYLARRWLHQAPRLLIVDETGEWVDRAAKVDGFEYDFTSGLPATIDALHRHAHERRWRVVTDLDKWELMELAGRILPRGKIRQGYTAQIGGMAILIEEADAAIGPVPTAEMRGLFRRGRHGGLTVFASSQRPNISKEVTANCEYVALLSLHEPRDVEYFEDVFGDRATAERALQWVNDDAHPHRVALWQTLGRTLYLVDANGKTVEYAKDDSGDISHRGTRRPGGAARVVRDHGANQSGDENQ